MVLDMLFYSYTSFFLLIRNFYFFLSHFYLYHVPGNTGCLQKHECVHDVYSIVPSRNQDMLTHIIIVLYKLLFNNKLSRMSIDILRREIYCFSWLLLVRHVYIPVQNGRDFGINNTVPPSAL